MKPKEFYLFSSTYFIDKLNKTIRYVLYNISITFKQNKIQGQGMVSNLKKSIDLASFFIFFYVIQYLNILKWLF